jgi:hypothetical protein
MLAPAGGARRTPPPAPAGAAARPQPATSHDQPPDRAHKTRDQRRGACLHLASCLASVSVVCVRCAVRCARTPLSLCACALWPQHVACVPAPGWGGGAPVHCALCCWPGQPEDACAWAQPWSRCSWVHQTAHSRQPATVRLSQSQCHQWPEANGIANGSTMYHVHHMSARLLSSRSRSPRHRHSI